MDENGTSLGGGQHGDNEIVRWSFRFGFFDNDWGQANIIQDDVEGVICQTQYFLSELVQNATATKTIHAKATEIDWGYFEDQDLPAQINFTLEFLGDLEPENVTWINEVVIPEMEELGQLGLQNFITNWVWMAEPLGINVFAHTDQMAFDGVVQGHVEGALQEVECPATLGGGQNGDNEIVRLSFRFGFFDDDWGQASIIQEDVEGVICQTQYFLSELVQNATATKSIHAKARD